MSALYERYRPGCWQEVIGQTEIVSRLQMLAARDQLAGKAFWLSGQSGTGKSTIARLIAHEVCDDELFITELDAQWLTPSRIKELERESQMRGWGEKGGKAYIVNEAHGLSEPAIRQLLITLEPPPPHVVWIFTTTIEGQADLYGSSIDASPLLSRCLPFNLSRRNLSRPFAERAREIAQREGLDGQPIEKYVRLAQTHRNNLRAMLSDIEAGAMMS